MNSARATSGHRSPLCLTAIAFALGLSLAPVDSRSAEPSWKATLSRAAGAAAGQALAAEADFEACKAYAYGNPDPRQRRAQAAWMLFDCSTSPRPLTSNMQLPASERWPDATAFALAAASAMAKPPTSNSAGLTKALLANIHWQDEAAVEGDSAAEARAREGAIAIWPLLESAAKLELGLAAQARAAAPPSASSFAAKLADHSAETLRGAFFAYFFATHDRKTDNSALASQAALWSDQKLRSLSRQ